MNLKILNELDRILKRNPSLESDRLSLCQVVNGVFDIELLSSMKGNYTLKLSVDNNGVNYYFEKKLML